MSKNKTLRYFDYVNHPYESVRDALKNDPLTLFRNATTSAASRAQSVATELHVNVAGIELGTDISISVKNMEEHPKKNGAAAVTRLNLEWSAAKMPRLFPFMKAELSIYPLTATETQLDLSGHYQPPMGVLGNVLDAAIGHRIAEASIHRFIADIAAYLREELSK